MNLRNKKEIHKCQAKVGGSGYDAWFLSYLGARGECGNNAKYFEKEKWWCGKHAPSKYEEREMKYEKRILERYWKAVKDDEEYLEKQLLEKGYFRYYVLGNRKGYLLTENGKMKRAFEINKGDLYEFKNNEFIKIKINEIWQFQN